MKPIKTTKANKYIAPSFRWVRVQKTESFSFGGYTITSRYLMGLITEHINKTQGKNLTIESFRIKDNDKQTVQTGKAEDVTPPEAPGTQTPAQ